MLRRLTALTALLALAASPVLPGSRLVCRVTGEAIAGCAEESCPAAPAARDLGCCEQRSASALPVADRSAARLELWSAVAAPGSVQAAPAAAPHLGGRLPASAAHAPGPPIFLAVRALLI